ncbi:metallophosphoesterase [Clostridium malenominatum]|uniref:Metallophosphoesterase n=1 Tax=Clostridium malenominatum TaxID=1539 RepID=A0ABN1IZK9_9CLOT
MKKVLLVIAVIVLTFQLYSQNNSLVMTRHRVLNNKLPDSFNNFKIIHLSDLHSKTFGKDNNKIVNKIIKENPDIIVITGDLIDRRKYNEEKAMLLVEKIKDIAPIYYVTGNHEGWSGKFSSLEKKLNENGVIVLRNESIILRKGHEEISILGVDDPAFSTTGYGEDYKGNKIIEDEIEKIKKAGSFNILLSHRPELFNLYREKDIDLVFSGHAHGGQIIIPFIGGILSPNQGFFPKYYKGLYKESSTTMVVSRGLGNSVFPQRIFNNPEIVCVELVRR